MHQIDERRVPSAGESAKEIRDLKSQMDDSHNKIVKSLRREFPTNVIRNVERDINNAYRDYMKAVEEIERLYSISD